MKPQDRHLKFVRWEESDHLYVGYCPDLLPWGGVCHAATEAEAHQHWCSLVAEEVEALLPAGTEPPPASTRPRRDAVPA